ncbi:MAG: hypothetical protein KAS71_18820 [Bacteroidales bacterium]|nr:hypothetical protein [Bacteroidales bacterium]
MNKLSDKISFLLEEYKSAVELTFHIDTLRNKLTSFFISISGIGITGLLLLLKKKNIESDLSDLNEIVSILMFLVTIIGHLFICVLAKIRRVQLEHFGIINNIRKYFYEDSFDFWNASQLSIKTLPKPVFFSGTYFWLLIIQILNVAILFLGIILIQDNLSNMLSCKGCITLTITALLSFSFQNIIYFYFAKPPIQEIYSTTSPLLKRLTMNNQSQIKYPNCGTY